MRIFGFIVGAVPFVFAGLRLLSTGSDLRYLWMALASTLGAAAIGWRRTPRAGGVGRLVLGVIVAAGFASAVAVVGGATAGPGITIVSAAFGLFSAGGIGIVVRSPDSCRDAPD